MTGKTFFNKVANGKGDVLGELLAHLDNHKISYCVIGGLAVNAYASPVISLDVDIVIAVEEFDRFQTTIPAEWSLRKERFSLNISTPYSELRIQIQTDSRYHAFLQRATKQITLGYELNVAAIEDVLCGKIWAYTDPERRETKRQKDYLDIMRLVESNPDILNTPAGKLAQNILRRK